MIKPADEGRPGPPGVTGEAPAALRIEPATQGDCEWAATLMSQSDPWVTLGRTPDGCRAVCLHQECQVFIARDRNERLGFLILQRRGVVGSPYLATICLREQSRGHGLGTIMLKWVEDYFRPQARHLFLCVSSFNPRARALYAREGFAQVGEFPDYFIEGASEILMHKRLR